MHRLLKTSKSGRLKITINFGSFIIKDEDKKKKNGEEGQQFKIIVRNTSC